MAVLPPEAIDPYEGMTPREKDFAQKKEVIYKLRALVETPGWQYLCNLLQQEAWRVKQRQMSAGSLDALLAVNLDLREAETYVYVIGLPETVINEFSVSMETSQDD